ncbi:hypothetical protein GGP41_002808 [Bipolaris sorokiniana]|uniref:Uncharacterized protein n=1 Tax=Cochliobolus sativus TaxID=45130 RepID=A0A8H5Z7M0_COCSA|nr:hypothetical protein GGP41_002808 [Bipolaris sorokiniana]
MELSDFDVAVSKLNIDEGDTIKDVMNVPFTIVVDAPVQDFGTLYPHDQTESDEDKQMSKHHRLIEGKLRAQVSAQELGSKIAATKEITEQYTTQNGYVGGKSDAEPTRDSPIFQESPDTNANKPSPPTPLPDRTRRASEPTLLSSTSPTPVPYTLDTPSKAPYKPLSSPPSKRHRNPDSRKADPQRPRYGARCEVEEEEEAALADLEQYRAMDLAPLDPIMQSSTAGDLITHGTPIKVRDVDIFCGGR